MMSPVAPHRRTSFGLAGLAAPQGVLGPQGTKRGAGDSSAPLFVSAPSCPSGRARPARPALKRKAAPARSARDFERPIGSANGWNPREGSL